MLSAAGLAGVRVGYCPQQDALDPLLTGQEHLRYYCSLRGVPRSCIPQVRPWAAPGGDPQLGQAVSGDRCRENVPERRFGGGYRRKRSGFPLWRPVCGGPGVGGAA